MNVGSTSARVPVDNELAHASERCFQAQGSVATSNLSFDAAAVADIDIEDVFVVFGRNLKVVAPRYLERLV